MTHDLDVKCCYCSATEDLRPYGPGAAPVCFACGTSLEHEMETSANFLAQLNAAQAMSTLGMAIELGDGPAPL